MPLMLKELLQNEKFKSFRFAAGMKGMENRIGPVNILDYEYTGDDACASGLFEKRSFVLSSLMFAKDDPGRVLEALRQLEKDGVGALAVKSVYYHELPPDAAAFADAKAFPVLMYDGPAPYFEEIVVAVDEMVRFYKERDFYEEKIELLLSNVHPPKETDKAAKELVPDISGMYRAVYLRFKIHEESGALSALLRANNAGAAKSIFSFRGGALLICPDPREEDAEFDFGSALSGLGVGPGTIYTGASRRHDAPEELCFAIKEALYAEHIAEVKGLGQLEYEQLGIMRALMPLENDPWLAAYASSVIAPILAYDAAHAARLLDTLRSYVETGGDIAKTAALMFTHKNTIHYRLKLIRNILKIGDEKTDMELFAELTLAVKFEDIRKK